MTLTQDFWLADAPCTQALYAAVTDRDPSQFKGADRPVETVSWNDVQAFLQALHERMPRLAMALPSEAQWEYACRAGTTDARYGEVDAIAWYLAATRAAKRIRFGRSRPTLGGCMTCSGTYGSGAMTVCVAMTSVHAYDPIGPMHEGTLRVLRGGSWLNPARFVRAAYRTTANPSHRDSDYGFRLSRGLGAPSRQA